MSHIRTLLLLPLLLLLLLLLLPLVLLLLTAASAGVVAQQDMMGSVLLSVAVVLLSLSQASHESFYRMRWWAWAVHLRLLDPHSWRWSPTAKSTIRVPLLSCKQNSHTVIVIMMTMMMKQITYPDTDMSLVGNIALIDSNSTICGTPIITSLYLICPPHPLGWSYLSS